MSALSNERHEAFAHSIADGLTPVAAYRAAFPNSLNWQEATVEVRAEALANNPMIKLRVEEISDDGNPSVLSRHDRMVILTHIALNDNQSIKSRMGAIDMLNKMDGEYVKKIEAKVANDFDATASDIAAILAETDDED